MTWIDLLTLIGSIGLILYGMRLMSEGLQKIVGDGLRKVQAAMSHNQVTRMITGVVVTALMQSSSAMTVMVVSFVNAGLLSLAESMAIIMGANVGTTATTWLIALLGFRFDIYRFVFPIIALSLPLIMSANGRRNAWGEFIIGFALLFLGIRELQLVLPAVGEYTMLVDFLHDVCNPGLLHLLCFLAIGVLLTMVIQASSATFIIAALFCDLSWLTFEMGCALIIGANIGTCFTPLLASRSANCMAKRAATGHLLFNAIGAILAVVFFRYFCDGINLLCQYAGLGNPRQYEHAAMGLAMFHTMFNFAGVCLLLPFTRQMVRLVTLIIPDTVNQEDDFNLQYINKGFMTPSGELALMQVQNETARYGQEVYKMFGMLQAMLDEQMGSERQLELMSRIRRMEEESDRAELEIAQFLNNISPKTLSDDSEQMCRNLYKEVDELESIADSICHISMTLNQKYEQRVRFTPTMNASLRQMMQLTDQALVHTLNVLTLEDVPRSAVNKAYNIEDEINQLRNDMLDALDRKEIEYQQNTYFMFVINECEKIGDYVINLITAASENIN